jgi:hypothetical protein
MAFDKLKIKFAPSSFAPMAEAHNAVVAFLQAIQGVNGIKVTVTEGNMLIEGTGAGSEGAAISVVGDDGKLNLVPKHSTWATPTAYPTLLRVNFSGTQDTRMTGAEVSVNDTSLGVYSRLSRSSIELHGANDLNIDESALTHDMEIREVDVCDGGVAKKMLVIASAPY